MLGGWDEQAVPGDWQEREMEREGEGEGTRQYVVCGRCGTVIEVPEGVEPTMARCPACWERAGASRSDRLATLGAPDGPEGVK